MKSPIWNQPLIVETHYIGDGKGLLAETICWNQPLIVETHYIQQSPSTPLQVMPLWNQPLIVEMHYIPEPTLAEVTGTNL